ncbi:MAG: carboxymuconolactone decarboxylase family protein [Pseudomonadota bacterium]
MTQPFPLHDAHSAPQAARPALAATQQSFGMIPNLERVMATAPALLAAYSAAWALFDTTSLTPVERQVVYQTANVENECDYCVPWHTYLAQQAQAGPTDVAAMRSGTPLSTPRLEALRTFARRLIHTRGKILEADLAAFLAAGYTPQAALEVVLGIAIKTMSNFTNSVAGTPLDPPVQDLAWAKPTIAMRGAAAPARAE